MMFRLVFSALASMCMMSIYLCICVSVVHLCWFSVDLENIPLELEFNFLTRSTQLSG